MTARVGRWLTVLATLALVLSLAFAGSRVTWHAAGVTIGAPVGQLPSATGDAPEALPDLAPIIAFAPFGRPVEVAPTEVPVEETSLQLVLHGVVLSDVPERSVAYISGRERPLQAYGVGDPVAAEAVLDEVLADHVVLGVEGRRELLYFPKAKSGQDPATDAIRARMQAAAGAVGVPAAGSSPDEVIDFWRRRIAENPAAVLDQLGLIATDDGYRVGEGAHPGVQRAGFREGDVVATVNGQQVGDVERDRTLYDEIAAAGRARVELIRDGRTIVMSFPLR